MHKLRIVTQDAYDRLRAALKSTTGIAAYTQPGPCGLLQLTDFQEIPLYSLRGNLHLNMAVADTERASTDAQNAEITYAHIGNIKPVYASDPRIWAALTHDTCWEYARWRFPIPSDPQKARAFIRSHWLVAGHGLAALRRNALARLWWAAALTVAPWEKEPAFSAYTKADRFYYTKVLLASQQVYQDVVEREFGSNTYIRIAFLDSLERARPSVASLDELVKRASVRMTLLLEYRHIPTIPLNELQASCDDVVNAAVTELKAT